MAPFLRDLRHGGRALRHAPWYSLTVISVLAVGIGLTTVAFAVVDGVLFKPLPFERAGELYLVRADASTAPQAQPPAVSWRDIRAWQERSPGFAMTVISHGTPGSSASIDGRVFLAAVVLTLATCALVAVWPARLAARLGTTARFDGTDPTASRPVRGLARPIVATQIALGFVLLTAGGLTVSSLAAAWWNDTGFQRDRMILLELFVSHAASPAETREKLEGVPALVGSVDGVDAVAVSTIQPLFTQRTNAWTNVLPQGWTGEIAGVSSRQVSANYFEVMGLRLVDGRWPSPAEWNDGRAAIVSESAARMLWPDRTNIGRLLVPRARRPVTPPATVIAIVADARYLALDTDPAGDVLGSILAALAGRGYRLEPATTHEDALFASVKHRALPAWLFGSLGLGALVVLGAGIFGLLAMSAAQRTREVGIRVALGATRGRVVRLLVREQMAAVATGLGAGALVSLWTIRFIESQLYGIGALDPRVWTGVAALLGIVALTTTLVPALRAARTDAVRALRAE